MVVREVKPGLEEIVMIGRNVGLRGARVRKAHTHVLKPSIHIFKSFGLSFHAVRSCARWTCPRGSLSLDRAS